MNVIENMLMIYNTTRTEDTNHRILSIWLNALDRVPKMKIADLADFSYTSTSTVIRLINILGFQKYTAFVHALQTCLDQYPGLNRISALSPAFSPESLQDMFFFQLETYVSEIRQLSAVGQFNGIARDMHAYGFVTIFSYAAMLCEFNLQYDLFMSGVNCEVIPYDTAKLEYSKRIRENSYVLAFYPNRIDDLAILREVLRNAKNRGCKVSLISSCTHLTDTDPVDTFIRFTGGTPASDAFFFQMFLSVLTLEYRSLFLD